MASWKDDPSLPLPPSTWPAKAEDEGTESICVGSPARFRNHEFVGGSCRWCPRQGASTAFLCPEGYYLRLGFLCDDCPDFAGRGPCPLEDDVSAEERARKRDERYVR